MLASVRGPICFNVEKKDIILLRGPNGSGKTSVLRALAGLPAALPFDATHDASVAYAPQDARDALVGLTVSGEFRLRARATPTPLAGLASRASTELSSGETRRVVLSACDGPVILLLDEPNEGLDAEGRDTLRALITRAAAHGAVVLADHGRGFEALATKIVELAPAARAPLPPIPRGEGAPILRASATTIRGRALPSLALGPGFHVLRGASGSGKSTLLLRLAGLLDPAGVSIGGAPPDPGSNVRLLLPRARDHLTRERVADECPASPFVPSALHERHPLALSGGEAQRVALAKAFAVMTPVLLLDEPEAHLDDVGRVLLVEAIARRVKEGGCVLAATHDRVLATLAQTEVNL